MSKLIGKLKLANIKPRIFECLRNGYSFNSLRKDIIAGVTVGIVAVPLASAFAIASGLPPERGFFTAIVAGFFISFLGGSRYQIGGPTGAFVVVVYEIVMELGYDGLAIATVLAGIFLIIFAYTKLGSMIKFIPYPVVVGFTAGIAVILSSTELKDFFGLDMGEIPANFFDKCDAYASAIGTVNLWALTIGLTTTLLVLFVRRRFKKIPAHVFAIMVITALVYVFSIPVDTIGSRFGELPNSLPMPYIPHLPLNGLGKIISAAFTIALLAAIESLLSAVVADGMTGDRHNSDTELFGQGVGNVMSAMFGGIPATGAIARTVTNIKAGGVTPLAGMIHAVVLLLFIMYFSSLVEQIPMAAIAGMLMVVSWDMFDYKRMFRFKNAVHSDIFVMLISFLLTVIIDITVAVEVGVVTAALIFMKRMSDVANLDVLTANNKNTPNTDRASDPDDLMYKTVPSEVGVYEMNGPFFFGAADKLISTLESIANIPKVVILRMRKVPVMDTTGLHALEVFADKCKHTGVTLIISGVQPQPYELLDENGLVDILGKKNVAKNIDFALERAKEILNEKNGK